MRSAREAALEGLLRDALVEQEDHHPAECASTAEVEIQEDGEVVIYESEDPCDCWMSRAKALLDQPEAKPVEPGLARWDGEECGDPECGDSSTYHANNGTGICTKVGCGCMKFVPTGRPNTKAR